MVSPRFSYAVYPQSKHTAQTLIRSTIAFSPQTSVELEVARMPQTVTARQLFQRFERTDRGVECVQVTDMASMFDDATSFNMDLSNWDVSRVTGMTGMFFSATSFNADLCKWNVLRVTNMYVVFAYVTSFNADLSKWNVLRVTDVNRMFYGAVSFNTDLSDWDVLRVTSMAGVFAYAILVH
jgi:surface protein